MEWYQVLLLALIQGLTEFLPISSSAHLILPSEVLGWPDQGLAFDVAVHVGSLIAVLAYFRKDVWLLASNWGLQIARQTHDQVQAKLAWLVILATIPAGMAGVLFDDFIEQNLRSALVIAITTIGFGLVLLWSERAGIQTVKESELTWKTALLIGMSQALALIPGTSRSGITMTAGLFLGLTKSAAARFSFLLSIPLILAAGGKKTLDLSQQGVDAPWSDILLGVGLSAVSAYLCIHFFLKIIEKIGFLPFVIYRLLLGGGLLLMVFAL